MKTMLEKLSEQLGNIETYLRFLAMSELTRHNAPKDRDGYKPFADLDLECAREALSLVKAHLPALSGQEPEKKESSDLQYIPEVPQCQADGSQ